MCNKYNKHAKKYFKTEEEFILDRIRNYFSPIGSYFKIKEDLENGKISEDKKEDIQKILEETEKQCKISIEKIIGFLKKDKSEKD